MKRMLSLVIALLMAAALLPLGASADMGLEDFTIFAESVNAVSLGVGDTFEVTYLTTGMQLADCTLKLRYPAEYVTPVACDPIVANWTHSFRDDKAARFGEDPDYEWENTCDCELEERDDIGAYSFVRAHVDFDFYYPYDSLFKDKLVKITYRIDSLPYTDSLPVDEIGAYFELLPEVLDAACYIDVESTMYYGVTAEYPATGGEPVRVYMPLAPIPWPVYVPEVTYTGAAVFAPNAAVGDRIDWTLSVSEGSCMWSGMWMVDYPEEYLAPVSSSVTWAGSLTAQINASIDDETQFSDVPAFVCNIDYEGQTGGNPVGEPGNRYSLIGMYLTSFGFNGLQAGGEFARITYEFTAIPEDGVRDELGAFIELPVTVIESTCWIPGAQIVSPYSTEHIAPHGSVLVENGRVYFELNGFIVTFFGFGGEELASSFVPYGEPASAYLPEAPASVMADGLKYVFMGWDGDVDAPVTQDAEFHAVYRAVGDVDGDGELTFTDISALYGFTLGTSAFAVPLEIGDVNGDGEITFADIGALYVVILG